MQHTIFYLRESLEQNVATGAHPEASMKKKLIFKHLGDRLKKRLQMQTS
jgi:hypothetical protein